MHPPTVQWHLFCSLASKLTDGVMGDSLAVLWKQKCCYTNSCSNTTGATMNLPQSFKSVSSSAHLGLGQFQFRLRNSPKSQENSIYKLQKIKYNLLRWAFGWNQHKKSKTAEQGDSKTDVLMASGRCLNAHKVDRLFPTFSLFAVFSILE